MKNDTYRSLHRELSTKSLSRAKVGLEPKSIVMAKVVPLPQPKKEQSNQFTITTNPTSNVISKRQEQYLIKIKTLEGQLKRKLSQDSILRHLFKTKTPAEISHIEIYLQIKKLEDQLKKAHQLQNEYKIKAKDLEEELYSKQSQHMQNIQMIEYQVERKGRQWASEKTMLIDNKRKLEDDYQNGKFLLEEIKKKNNELKTKLKDLSEELEIQKQAKTLEELRDRQQLQNHISELSSYNDSLRAELEQAQSSFVNTRDELQHTKDEMELMKNEIDNLIDEKQKLQLRIRQIEDINSQYNFQKQHESNKFSEYYSKLKKDYQIEIQSILSNHQQDISCKSERINALEGQCKSIQNQKLVAEQEIVSLKHQLQELQAKNQLLSETQGKARKQFDQSEEKLAKISRQNLQGKYQRQQIKRQLQSQKAITQDKKDKIDQLQKTISSMSEKLQKFESEIQNYKRQSQISQTYLSVNNKIYNDNFKTLGRLIQINHKLKNHLGLKNHEQFNVNEQSLTEVVSLLAQLLQKAMSSQSTDRKRIEQMIRQRNMENRQTMNLLEQCKSFINNNYAENLLSKYIVLTRDRKTVVSEQVNNQKLELYHQLIENLMNLSSIKAYNSQQSQNINIKDSLDSTYLHRASSQSNKKFNRHTMDKQSSSKATRPRDRVQTEPSCDLPLKVPLFLEENKQNLNINLVKDDRKDTKSYINSVREKISNKLSQKRAQSKNGSDLRSEVEKKYFRL